MEHPIKMDDLGVPPFSETPISTLIDHPIATSLMPTAELLAFVEASCPDLRRPVSRQQALARLRPSPMNPRPLAPQMDF